MKEEEKMEEIIEEILELSFSSIKTLSKQKDVKESEGVISNRKDLLEMFGILIGKLSEGVKFNSFILNKFYKEIEISMDINSNLSETIGLITGMKYIKLKLNNKENIKKSMNFFQFLEKYLNKKSKIDLLNCLCKIIGELLLSLSKEKIDKKMKEIVKKNHKLPREGEEKEKKQEKKNKDQAKEDTIKAIREFNEYLTELYYKSRKIWKKIKEATVSLIMEVGILCCGDIELLLQQPFSLLDKLTKLAKMNDKNKAYYLEYIFFIIIHLFIEYNIYQLYYHPNSELTSTTMSKNEINFHLIIEKLQKELFPVLDSFKLPKLNELEPFMNSIDLYVDIGILLSYFKFNFILNQFILSYLNLPLQIFTSTSSTVSNKLNKLNLLNNITNNSQNYLLNEINFEKLLVSLKLFIFIADRCGLYFNKSTIYIHHPSLDNKSSHGTTSKNKLNQIYCSDAVYLHYSNHLFFYHLYSSRKLILNKIRLSYPIQDIPFEFLEKYSILFEDLFYYCYLLIGDLLLFNLSFLPSHPSSSSASSSASSSTPSSSSSTSSSNSSSSSKDKDKDVQLHVHYHLSTFYPPFHYIHYLHEYIQHSSSSATAPTTPFQPASHHSSNASPTQLNHQTINVNNLHLINQLNGISGGSGGNSTVNYNNTLSTSIHNLPSIIMNITINNNTASSYYNIHPGSHSQHHLYTNDLNYFIFHSGSNNIENFNFYDFDNEITRASTGSSSSAHVGGAGSGSIGSGGANAGHSGSNPSSTSTSISSTIKNHDINQKILNNNYQIIVNNYFCQNQNYQNYLNQIITMINSNSSQSSISNTLFTGVHLNTPSTSTAVISNNHSLNKILFQLLKHSIYSLHHFLPYNIEFNEFIFILAKLCFHIDKEIRIQSKELLFSILKSKPMLRNEVVLNYSIFLLTIPSDQYLYLRKSLSILNELLLIWCDPKILKLIDPDQYSDEFKIKTKFQKRFPLPQIESIILILLTSPNLYIRNDCYFILKSLKKLNDFLPSSIKAQSIPLFYLIQENQAKILKNIKEKNKNLHSFYTSTSSTSFSSSSPSSSGSSAASSATTFTDPSINLKSKLKRSKKKKNVETKNRKLNENSRVGNKNTFYDVLVSENISKSRNSSSDAGEKEGKEKEDGKENEGGDGGDTYELEDNQLLISYSISELMDLINEYSNKSIPYLSTAKISKRDTKNKGESEDTQAKKENISERNRKSTRQLYKSLNISELLNYSFIFSLIKIQSINDFIYSLSLKKIDHLFIDQLISWRNYLIILFSSYSKNNSSFLQNKFIEYYQFLYPLQYQYLFNDIKSTHPVPNPSNLSPSFYDHLLFNKLFSKVSQNLFSSFSIIRDDFLFSLQFSSTDYLFHLIESILSIQYSSTMNHHDDANLSSPMAASMGNLNATSIPLDPSGGDKKDHKIKLENYRLEIVKILEILLNEKHVQKVEFNYALIKYIISTIEDNIQFLFTIYNNINNCASGSSVPSPGGNPMGGGGGIGSGPGTQASSGGGIGNNSSGSGGNNASNQPTIQSIPVIYFHLSLHVLKISSLFFENIYEKQMKLQNNKSRTITNEFRENVYLLALKHSNYGIYKEHFKSIQVKCKQFNDEYMKISKKMKNKNKKKYNLFNSVTGSKIGGGIYSGYNQAAAEASFHPFEYNPFAANQGGNANMDKEAQGCTTGNGENYKKYSNKFENKMKEYEYWVIRCLYNSIKDMDNILIKFNCFSQNAIHFNTHGGAGTGAGSPNVNQGPTKIGMNKTRSNTITANTSTSTNNSKLLLVEKEFSQLFLLINDIFQYSNNKLLIEFIILYFIEFIRNLENNLVKQELMIEVCLNYCFFSTNQYESLQDSNQHIIKNINFNLSTYYFQLLSELIISNVSVYYHLPSLLLLFLFKFVDIQLPIRIYSVQVIHWLSIRYFKSSSVSSSLSNYLLISDNYFNQLQFISQTLADSHPELAFDVLLEIYFKLPFIHHPNYQFTLLSIASFWFHDYSLSPSSFSTLDYTNSNDSQFILYIFVVLTFHFGSFSPSLFPLPLPSPFLFLSFPFSSPFTFTSLLLPPIPFLPFLFLSFPFPLCRSSFPSL